MVFFCRRLHSGVGTSKGHSRGSGGGSSSAESFTAPAKGPKSSSRPLGTLSSSNSHWMPLQCPDYDIIMIWLSNDYSLITNDTSWYRMIGWYDGISMNIHALWCHMTPDIHVLLEPKQYHHFIFVIIRHTISPDFTRKANLGMALAAAIHSTHFTTFHHLQWRSILQWSFKGKLRNDIALSEDLAHIWNLKQLSTAHWEVNRS